MHRRNEVKIQSGDAKKQITCTFKLDLAAPCPEQLARWCDCDSRFGHLIAARTRCRKERKLRTFRTGLPRIFPWQGPGRSRVRPCPVYHESTMGSWKQMPIPEQYFKLGAGKNTPTKIALMGAKNIIIALTNSGTNGQRKRT